MSFDTERTAHPVCPHCGNEERDAWEIDFGSGSEGEAEITCGDCGREYKAERIVDVSYTTFAKDGTPKAELREELNRREEK